MIALIDYGAGNMHSVHKAFEAVGARVQPTRSPQAILSADKVVLPGVGAFGDCMAELRRAGLLDALQRVVEQGQPFLGICVGMQVLFQESEELGLHAGLGLLPGRVVRFPDALVARGLKIPHTGWNQIQPADNPLFHDLPPGAWVYFNHAYYCQAQPEHVLAASDYGGDLAAVVGRDNIYGIQFHPEKSQQVGLRILKNFCEGVGN